MLKCPWPLIQGPWPAIITLEQQQRLIWHQIPRHQGNRTRVYWHCSQPEEKKPWEFNKLQLMILWINTNLKTAWYQFPYTWLYCANYSVIHFSSIFCFFFFFFFFGSVCKLKNIIHGKSMCKFTNLAQSIWIASTMKNVYTCTVYSYVSVFVVLSASIWTSLST